MIVPPEEVQEIEPATASGSGRGSQRAEHEDGPQFIYRCSCREAIQSTYTSQYIAGVAFMVTTFVKTKEVSYYHLRAIYCIVLMHSTIGGVCIFDRETYFRRRFSGLMSRWQGQENESDRSQCKSEFKMRDFALTLNQCLLFGFTIFIAVGRDKDFDQCYKLSQSMFIISFLGLELLMGLAIWNNGRYSPAI
jgi:hypothetical protein